MPEALERLIDNWQYINAALIYNQHYGLLLDTNVDYETGRMECVCVVTDNQQNAVFAHAQMDLLAMATTTLDGLPLRQFYTQIVHVSQPNFDRVQQFLLRNIDPELRLAFNVVGINDENGGGHGSNTNISTLSVKEKPFDSDEKKKNDDDQPKSTTTEVAPETRQPPPINHIRIRIGDSEEEEVIMLDNSDEAADDVITNEINRHSGDDDVDDGGHGGSFSMSVATE
jgi:hypothetical protein